MTEPRPMPTDRPPLQLRDVRERSRYEATLGDEAELAASLEYELAERLITLLHTEVEQGFEGQGLGSRVVRAVLDDVRRRDLKVIPKCPFLVRWLERHPEQHDVLAHPLGEPGPPPSGGGLEPA